MKSVTARAALLAATIFAALFVLKLTIADDSFSDGNPAAGLHDMAYEFDISRKNYASIKSGGSSAVPIIECSLRVSSESVGP